MPTKEEIYDSQINPLMAEIIRICKEHKIAHIASFALDGDLLCTTHRLADECDPPDCFFACRDQIMGTRSTMMAITITKAQ